MKRIYVLKFKVVTLSAVLFLSLTASAQTQFPFRQITSDGIEKYFPKWSPDGQTIMYVEDNEGLEQIKSIDLRRNRKRRITPERGYESAPAWSADGKKIVFTKSSDIRDMDPTICIMDNRGKNRQKITEGRFPNLSPDGKQIAFEKETIEHYYEDNKIGISGHFNIWITDLDGNKKQITHNDQGDEYPVWSPDGRKIAFIRNREEPDIATDIWLMNPDGNEQRLLVKSAALPTWSPNGKKIAFSVLKEEPQSVEIGIINADGSGYRGITDKGEIALYPDWSPNGREITFISNWGEEVPDSWDIWIISGLRQQ